MGKSGFEKAFKKAVPNFDERLMWFIHKKHETFICFVLNNKLSKFRVYREQYKIDLWKQHFIEFFETGLFDYNGYWVFYGNDKIAPEDIDKVYKIPLCVDGCDEFYPHSKELGRFLCNYRIKYPTCGIKLVTKPI